MFVARYTCPVEKWGNEYRTHVIPRHGETMSFLDKAHLYEVIEVVHGAMPVGKVPVAGNPEPVIVIVRPQERQPAAWINQKIQRRDATLYAIDPDAEERRVNEMATHDYRE